MQDPLIVHAPACVAASISSSVLAQTAGLPSIPVDLSLLSALNQMEGPCRFLASSLRPFLRLGLPVDSSIIHHGQYGNWISQKSWMTLVPNFSVGLLSETLPPRLRKLRELFSGSHAGEWMQCPTRQQRFPFWQSRDW